MNNITEPRRTVLVTGGLQGIGRAIAEAFAKTGADVALLDIDGSVHEAAQEIQKSAGSRAVGCRADVTSEEQIERAVTEVNERLGRIDVLVNNAGIVGRRALSWDGSTDDWMRTIDVNLVGTYRVSKAVLPQMVAAASGRVINISSISGKQGSTGNSAYSASKHAVIGLTRTLARELALLGLHGITANAICPGVVDTPLVHGEGQLLDGISALTGQTREAVLEQHVLSQSLQHRLLDPEEVAGMAVYLASDLARGITGQAINVDAGSVFH
ncbi:SDR family NAD(P)-dependent oxidoreductase [Streptomyces shenzhenensis]|uniref:SDR family NAD(P)-dependent oxidoreductase n=1 Tax=Streptomyces shenzhenensis TaxID=943815 RepID=UPI001F38757B|nr:SDR family NAD(P)-dependent oxidoreductase [Streptomyces shenzhenensis]